MTAGAGITDVTVAQGPADNDGLGDVGRAPFAKYNKAVAALYNATLFMGPPSADATGALDTAYLALLVGMLPAGGGAIIFGPGRYIFTSGIAFTIPVALRGQGSSDGSKLGGNTASTVCEFLATTTGGGFTFQATASMRDIHVRNPSTSIATAGAAVFLNNAPGSIIDSCSTYGFFVGVDSLSSNDYVISNSKIYNPSGYGGRHACAVIDEGDCTWYGNQFNAGGVNNTAPVAALLWQSGGGFKFINNKINREPPTLPSSNFFQYGVLMQPTGGTTGDMKILGNSIENWRTSGIFLDASVATGGSFDAIEIYANQFQGNGVGSYAITATGSSVYTWKDVRIEASVLRTCGGYCQLVQNVNTCHLGGFTADQMSSTPILIGSAGGSSQTTATVVNVSYDATKFLIQLPASPQSYYSDFTVNATDSHKRGACIKDFSRAIPNLGSVPATVQVGQLTIRANQQCRLRVTVAGNFSGIVGGLYAQAEWSLSCAAGNIIAATAIGSPINPAALTINLNLATAFLAIVTLTTVSGQGLSASVPGSGEIKFEIMGGIQDFSTVN